MTIWVDAATTRSKLKGIVQGLSDSLTSRLPETLTAEKLEELRKVLASLAGEAAELGATAAETKTGDQPKLLVPIIARTKSALHSAGTGQVLREPTVMGIAVHNLIAEAYTIGKEGNH